MPQLLYAKANRFAGHRVLCTTQKEQSNLVFTSVSSHGHGAFDMERNEILCRWTFGVHWLHKFHHSRCDVCILLGVGGQATIQKQYLVEEVHHSNANRK